MSKKPKFRVMPDATPEEDAALEASIKARGIVIPIIKNDRGDIVDGHRRDRIAAKNKIKNVPTLTISGGTEEEYRQLARELNLLRRPITRKQKERVIRETLRRSPQLCDTTIAKVCGASDKTVAKYRKKMIESSEIPNIETREGPPRRGFKRIYTYTKSAQQQAADTLRNRSDLPDGQISLGQIRRRRIGAQPQQVLSESQCDLWQCDFREMPIEEESLDVVFTDPPYGRRAIPLYHELGLWCRQYLKDGGILATYYGVGDLEEVVNAICSPAMHGPSTYGYGLHSFVISHMPSVTYHWNCCLPFEKNQTNPLFPKRVSSRYRGLLLFSKGKWPRTQFIPDLCPFNGKKEKRLIRWQQGLAGVQYYLNLLTKPGQRVADPFLGSATTAIATRNLNKGLHFFGSDVDRKAIKAALKRWNEEIA